MNSEDYIVLASMALWITWNHSDFKRPLQLWTYTVSSTNEAETVTQVSR